MAGTIDKIKSLRDETKVSQEDLANYIGISRLTYLNIEAGKREIKEEELKKVADFFERPLNYFMDKNEVQNKDDKNYKLKQLILYIAEQTKDISSFGETVLNKVLYFCDFNYYEWTDSLITGTIYKKLPFGPVPDGITNVLGEMQRDGLIALQNTTFHGYEQQKIIPLKETNLSFLDEIDKIAKSHEFAFPDTPTPKVVIDDALNKYKYFNAKQISEWSHLDKPWKCAKNIGEELEPGLTHYRSESFITNHHGL